MTNTVELGGHLVHASRPLRKHGLVPLATSTRTHKKGDIVDIKVMSLFKKCPVRKSGHRITQDSVNLILNKQGKGRLLPRERMQGSPRQLPEAGEGEHSGKRKEAREGQLM